MSVEKIYKLQEKPANQGQLMVQTIVFLGLITITALWAATQYAAWKLGFQAALGEPLLRLGSGFALYTPIDFLIWLLRFGHVEEAESAFTGGEWILGSLHFLFIPAIWLSIRRGKKLSQKADTYGSAHFADPSEVKLTGLLPTKSDGHDVYLATYTDPKTGKQQYLRDSGASHVSVVAPTGSGKGVGTVFPTLLSWVGSVIAYDMKKELWSLTAGFRKALGQVVMRFEPTCFDGTGARFNPLSEVRLRTPREVADAQNIAEMIVDPDGKGMEDHWAKTGHELLSAAILHVLYSERNKTLRGLVSFFCDPRRTIEQVAESMLNAHHDIDNSQRWGDPLTGRPTLTHPVVAEAARSFLNKSENERSGVQSTALSFLSLYRDPIVAMNTAVSDFKIADLMNHEKAVSLFIVVPPSDRKRLRPLTRLIFNLVLRNLTEKMDYKDGKQVEHYKHRLLMVMDEVPSLGRLDILEEAIAFVRSYGIKIMLIFQDFSQLHKAYTKDESLTSNTHVQALFTPLKLETAEIISKRLGETTVQRQTVSFSGNRLNPLPMHAMSATNEHGRPLLKPDEVLRLPSPVKSEDGKTLLRAGNVLVFAMGHAPIMGEQILFFKEPIWDKRSKIPAPVDSDRIIDNPRDIVIEPEAVDAVAAPANDSADSDELDEGLANDGNPHVSVAPVAESAPAGQSFAGAPTPAPVPAPAPAPSAPPATANPKLQSGLRPAVSRRQSSDGRAFTLDHETGEVTFDGPPPPSLEPDADDDESITLTDEQIAQAEAEEQAMRAAPPAPRIGAQGEAHAN